MPSSLSKLALTLSLGAFAAQSQAAVVCYDMYSDFVAVYEADANSPYNVGGDPSDFRPNFHASVSFCLPENNLSSSPDTEGVYVDDTVGKKLSLTIEGAEPSMTKTFDFFGAMTATIGFFGEYCYYQLSFLGGPLGAVANFTSYVDPNYQVGNDPVPSDTSNDFLLNLTNFAGYFSLSGPGVHAYDDISVWQNRQILSLSPAASNGATNVPDGGSALALLAAGFATLLFVRHRLA